MFRLVRVIVPSGRLSSLDAVELSQHLWTQATKNGQMCVQDICEESNAASFRGGEAAKVFGEGPPSNADGSNFGAFSIKDANTYPYMSSYSTSSCIAGVNLGGERKFSSTSAAGIWGRGNDNASSSGSSAYGMQGDSSTGNNTEAVNKASSSQSSKYGVQPTEAGPASIVRSIVKEHGPLTNHEVWTYAKNAGIKSKSHMKAMLKWLQTRNQVQLVCVTPPDKQAPIKAEGEFFYRIPKVAQLKAETKLETLQLVLARRKASSPS